MSLKKQDGQERVLAYQAATTLTYDEMEQVSGGSAGLYWTIHGSAAAVKVSGTESKFSGDGCWDY